MIGSAIGSVNRLSWCKAEELVNSFLTLTFAFGFIMNAC